MEIFGFVIRLITIIPIIAVFLFALFGLKYVVKDEKGDLLDAMKYSKTADISLYVLATLCFIIFVLALCCIFMVKELFKNPDKNKDT